MGRIIFILFYANLFIIDKVPLSEVFSLFLHALNLDLATASYLLVVPFFLVIAGIIIKKPWFDWVIFGFNTLMIVVYSMIVIGETSVYGEWKNKLDYKALYYLNHPTEIAHSAQTWNLVLLLLILLTMIAIGTWSYLKFFHQRQKPIKRRWLVAGSYFVLLPPFILLGIRGGLQAIPVNQAESYFSEHPIVNHVAVNPGFNLYESYLQSLSYQSENPFGFYPLVQAKATMLALHQVEKDTTVSILKNTRPNVVLIILESFSGDLIESLGGKAGITPQFHELEKNGVLFTNLYSSGNRSQQGMASIFSGFPSIPVTAITQHYNKLTKLPCITKDFKKMGYQTSYYYGGQLIYGGLRAYMLFNGFDRVLEGKDFDSRIPRGDLGVHDEFSLQKQLADLNKEKQPFFSALFTLSSHSPYDEPMGTEVNWGSNEQPFLNSAFYTDRSLGQYFEKAKKEAWFSNTLFILVADHSHNTYRNWPVNSTDYRRIPLLFYGDVIKDKWKGKKVSRISSQTDLAGTLLKQMNADATAYPWSRNLFNPYTREFAYFEINVGCGWIVPAGNFVYDQTTRKYLRLELPDSEKENTIREGKSYLETVFQRFMDY
ncbi:MAG: LTA synthase family protein [Bacteroidota bacterium]